MAVFCSSSLVEAADISEVFAASIFRAIILNLASRHKDEQLTEDFHLLN
jgi:hypothetical protein